MSYIENLKRMREEKNLTQKELAEKAGIAQPTYAQYERGCKAPTLPVAMALAEALDCSLEELAK